MDFSVIESMSIFSSNPKLLKHLKQNFKDEAFYEMHQLCKTIHFRCMNQNQWQQALNLLHMAIVYFSDKNQVFNQNLIKF